MEIPFSIVRAVLAMFAAISLMMLGEMLDYFVGTTDITQFMTHMVLCGAFAVLPHKISTGQNWARSTYITVLALHLVALALGVEAGGRVNVGVAWVSLPLEAFAIYQLLKKEATLWFEHWEQKLW